MYTPTKVRIVFSLPYEKLGMHDLLAQTRNKQTNKGDMYLFIELPHQLISCQIVFFWIKLSKNNT